MGIINFSKTKVMCPEINNILQVYRAKLRLQRYAPSSVKTYANALAKFLIAFSPHDIAKVELVQIEHFMQHLQEKQAISPHYQKQILASIGKFYQLFYERKLDLAALYPKRLAKPLPKYLTPTEVKRLLEQCTNQKHLSILQLLYGCGLRVSEVVALKIEDIDSDAMRILIRDPKGKVDRVVPLPRLLLNNLRLYYRTYRPKRFLFEGQTGGVYSVKSIQNFIKKYASNAQLTKRVFPHMLRHSYATHQLENGVNIRYVQTLLGHKSIKTTELYTHVAKISKGNILSPLDQL